MGGIVFQMGSQIWVQDPGGSVRLLSAEESAEEMAAREEERRKENENRRKEHEKRRKEEIAYWPQRKIEVVQELLNFLRVCQKTPAAERRKLSRWGLCEHYDWTIQRINHTPRRRCLCCCVGVFRDKLGDIDSLCIHRYLEKDWVREFMNMLYPYAGRAQRGTLLDCCVYLMWCPAWKLYKIGHTDDMRSRIEQHRRELDPNIECCSEYYTPLPPLFRRRRKCPLESFVHTHFRHYHVKTEASQELFALPEKDMHGFTDIVKAIEKHLLAIDILRLKALLSKFQAEC
ncbi:MAG TPA: GIY-YIG nuclease family protein [Gemmataceae bacterium]|nr:GIY-YIG nuclease family protein [Gemmataceae bacterium]